MQDLTIREQKIQARRKQTPWREFVKEIGSRFPLNLYNFDGTISRFPKTDRTKKVMNTKEFERNQELASYDVSKSFIDNFATCFSSSPKQALGHFLQNENVDYCDIVYGTKNAYLSFDIGDTSENILYSAIVNTNCKNVLNSTFIIKNSENIFSSSYVTEGFNIFFSRYIVNCANIRFSSNLVGCHDCIFCDGLENQSYCIENNHLSKEAYELKKQEILHAKQYFSQHRSKVKTIASNYGTKNSLGNALYYSQNVENGYYSHHIQDSRNVVFATGVEEGNHLYDCIDITVKATNVYASCFAGWADKVYCTVNMGLGTNIYYSFNLESCSYCLGCIGLKNKSFCILNKQYEKDERFAECQRIFQRMDEDGTLGQFFPASMNPFYFNDTVAYLIDDSFTKEEVTKEGYLRRDEEIKVDIPEGSEIVETHLNLPSEGGLQNQTKAPSDPRSVGAGGVGGKKLADFQGFNEKGEWHINPDILKKVIRDPKGNVYRIQKMEYDFLMKYGLPLPELHRLDRIKLGFKFK